MSEVIKTYQLLHPIEVRSKEGDVVQRIEQLELKKPKGRHLKAMDRADGEVAKMLALIASCAGVPPSAMDDLDGEDFAALGEVIEKDFFGGRLKIGAKYSAT